MLWRHAEFFFHARNIHQHVGHSINQGDMFIHQLRHIFIAGGNDHILFMFECL